jgi:hypothetical protein
LQLGACDDSPASFEEDQQQKPGFAFQADAMAELAQFAARRINLVGIEAVAGPDFGWTCRPHGGGSIHRVAAGTKHVKKRNQEVPAIQVLTPLEKL